MYLCTKKKLRKETTREKKSRDNKRLRAMLTPAAVHPPQYRQSLSTQIPSTSLNLIRVQKYKEVKSASSLSRTLSLDFIIPCTHLFFLDVIVHGERRRLHRRTQFCGKTLTTCTSLCTCHMSHVTYCITYVRISRYFL